MADKKIRIALVNQRYGLEVNGGSEYYTRQLAEHLKDIYDVEVLTTKALDYDTWEDYYQADTERINGILVRRFRTERKRNTLGMKILWRMRRYCPVLRRFWEDLWIDAQGPYSPELIQYISSHKSDYSVIIFVTYLYYHTVRGLPEAAEKAILLPTAHDEPYIYYDIYRHIFESPGGIIYLTPEEKEFVESRFPVAGKPNCIAGSGVDVPDSVSNEAFRKKYHIDGEYLIYVGRIDPSKGCGEMFRIFRKYKERHPDSTIKLVLIGRAVMDIPCREDIISLGFLSEQDKFDGISGAIALWLPSLYESLSISVLEAMSLGVPVLVNGKCEVLKGHCIRSHAGISYQNQEDAGDALERLLDKTRCDIMSENARRYIEENYQWDVIVGRISNLIKKLCT